MLDRTVVVNVEGGVATVLSNHDHVVVDWDNLKEGDTLPRGVVNWMVQKGYYGKDAFSLEMIEE